MKTKLVISLILSNSVLSQAAEPLPLSKGYWKSTAFRKAFNGSYRINARVEPFVDTKERVLLISIQEMMKRGKRKLALKKLQASVLAQRSAAVMFNVGNIAYELGDLKLAKKQYLKAIEKFPTFLRAKQNLAFLLARESDYKKAFPYLLEVIKLGSQDGAVMGLVGYCYQQKENFTSALQAFKNAQLTEPENLEWKIGEAYCYDSLGDNAKALNLYESIIKAKPNDTQYRLLLINLYQRTGQIGEAIVNLELLRRQNKLDVSNRVILGTLHLSGGSKTLGAKVIREVLNSEKLVDSDVAMNTVSYAIERDELALASEFHALINPKILKTKASQSRYKRQLARMKILINTQDVAAEKILLELILLDPLDADSLYLLAQFEANNKRKDEALIHYKQAHVGNGKMKNASLLERGKLLVKMRRYTEALADLTEYQQYAEGLVVTRLKVYIEAVRNLQTSSQ